MTGHTDARVAAGRLGLMAIDGGRDDSGGQPEEGEAKFIRGKLAWIFPNLAAFLGAVAVKKFDPVRLMRLTETIQQWMLEGARRDPAAERLQAVHKIAWNRDEVSRAIRNIGPDARSGIRAIRDVLTERGFQIGEELDEAEHVFALIWLATHEVAAEPRRLAR